jgi:hypothetical protein
MPWHSFSRQACHHSRFKVGHGPKGDSLGIDQLANEDRCSKNGLEAKKDVHEKQQQENEAITAFSKVLKSDF